MTADPLIRTCHFAGVLGLSQSTLNRLLNAGRIPPPDTRGQGNVKQWRLSTIRRWDERVAAGIETLLAIPTVRRAAYNGARNLETSHTAEPRPDSCGFFAPVPQDSCAPVSDKPEGVRENSQYPEPSVCGFEPPSGAHSCNGLFIPNLRKPT